MGSYQVIRSGKDKDGDIVRMCGDWGAVSKPDAIVHIERRIHSYFVQDRLYRRADVVVVDGPTGKYLRTDPNSNSADNLDNLPDC